MDLLTSSASDSVTDALQALNVRSTIFCLSELRGPWAFRVEASEVAKFHLVLSGSASLVLDGDDAVTVGAGDLVLLPHGDAHTFRDGEGSAVVPLEQLLRDYPLDAQARLRYGGDGVLTRLLCGGFSFADRVPDSTLVLLPRVLRVESSSTGAAAWLGPVLATLESETTEGRPGAGAIIAKIADVFVAEAIRAWLVGAEQTGLLVVTLLHDRPVARAVQTIHDRFSEHWTLELLAAHVGLSRTALATRFRRLTGDSPIRYLTKVRLSHAAGQLATGRLSMYEIARETGYQSDATLSRAFKREFGQAPGAYRERARRTPVIELAAAV
jgi:AraC-like DNA-binding protein